MESTVREKLGVKADDVGKYLVKKLKRIGKEKWPRYNLKKPKKRRNEKVWCSSSTVLPNQGEFKKEEKNSF